MDDLTDAFAGLIRSITTEYRAFDEGRNPVVHVEPFLDRRALSHVAVQYSAFSKNIVGILLAAQATLRTWPHVAEELGRNVEEEEGSQSAGRSHYELFRSGLLEEYGLDPEPLPTDAATVRFIHDTFSQVSNPTMTTAAGAVYAIEAVSAAELTVVRHLMNALSNDVHGRPLPGESTLGQFFDAHIDAFEPGHELGLRTTIQRHLVSEHDWSEFVEGFHSMLANMEIWWDDLADEARVTA